MSDTVLIAAIGAIVTTITAVTTGYFGVQLARINRVANATHKLINHESLVNARLLEASTRRNCVLSGNAPADVEVWKAAAARLVEKEAAAMESAGPVVAAPTVAVVAAPTPAPAPVSAAPPAAILHVTATLPPAASEALRATLPHSTPLPVSGALELGAPAPPPPAKPL